MRLITFSLTKDEQAMIDKYQIGRKELKKAIHNYIAEVISKEMISTMDMLTIYKKQIVRKE